jgi:hypothetical protein
VLDVVDDTHQRDVSELTEEPVKDSGAGVTRRMETGYSNSEDDVVTDEPLPEGSETTGRRETTVNEIQRNEILFKRIKNLYNNTCMVCGDRWLKGNDEGFSNVHHLMPLGEPHNGPDIPENVVVCPNHHEDFEHGMLKIVPQTLEVEHMYEDRISGRISAVRDRNAPPSVEHELTEGEVRSPRFERGTSRSTVDCSTKLS